MRLALAVSSVLMLGACEVADRGKSHPSPTERGGIVEVLPEAGVADRARIIMKVNGKVESDGEFDIPFSQLYYGSPRMVRVEATSLAGRGINCLIWAGKIGGPVDDTPYRTASGRTYVHCGG